MFTHKSNAYDHLWRCTTAYFVLMCRKETTHSLTQPVDVPIAGYVDVSL